MPITMTSEQRAVLAHVVIDPDAWLAHAEDVGGEEAAQKALDAKVERWQADYESAVAIYGDEYLTRAEREAQAQQPPAPDPVSAAPSLVGAAFGIEVAGGDISGIAGSFNFAAALYLGVGNYMLFFMREVVGSYFVTANGGGAVFETVEAAGDHLTIEARDSVGGSLIDVPRFDIQVHRL